MLVWILRLVGVIGVILGRKMMFSVLPTLFKFLPFLGNVVQFGVNIVCGVIGLAWALTVIAIAWLYYRPLIGIGLLLIVGGLIYFFSKRGKAKKAEEEAHKNEAQPEPEQPSS